MITLEINQEIVPKKHQLKKADVLRLSTLLVNVPKYVPGTIAVEFVDDARIQALNRMYRHKDKVTDVLSFTYSTQSGEHLGDVVVSYDQAVRQAEAGDIQLEIMDLVVHGILHVLGYDHEDAHDAELMFPQQDSLVQKLL
jgi:probable rRNA maturation factor